MFGIPGMLWWGLAAAIPILIHLFARQRYKRVQWAAMEFLLRAFKKTRKRIRLEHLLLLLLRILALLLFILALADPRLNTGGLLGRDNRRREVVILLDTSFSMGLTQSDGDTPFNRSKEQALKLVRTLRPGRLDTVTLITAGRPNRVLLKGADDLEQVTAELEHLEVGDGVTDFVGAFRMVDAIMEDLQSPPEIYLFSDMQKLGFVPATGRGNEKEPDRPQELLQSLIQQLRGRKAVVNLVAPLPTSTDNVAITDIRITSKAAVAGNATDFVVSLKNFGSHATGGTLHFHVDGSGAPVESVPIETLTPGGVATHAFRHVFQEAANHHVEAVFVADNLDVDNRRRLAFEVRERIQVLVVDGSIGGKSGEESSFFLTHALVPFDDGARESTFSYEVVDETGLEHADLRKVDILALVDISLLSPTAAKTIAEFVADGGGLLVFLGPKTKPEVLNNLLWREGSGVLPAKLEEPKGRDRYGEGPVFELHLDEMETPPLAYFNDPNILPYLSAIPIYRYYRTTFDPEDGAVRLLASFGTQDDPAAPTAPAIIEKRVGNGRTILVTTSADDSWNDLPAMPTYLPLVKEIAYHLARPEASLRNLLVGSSFYLVLEEFAERVTLSRGERALQELKPLPREGERGFEVKIPELDRAGLYRLAISAAPGERPGAAGRSREIFVAVNVDPRESDLGRVDEDFIFSSFPGAGVSWISDLDAAEKAAAAGGEEEIWWWLILAAAVCLLSETALSQLFGDRSRRRAA